MRDALRFMVVIELALHTAWAFAYVVWLAGMDIAEPKQPAADGLLLAWFIFYQLREGRPNE